MAGLILAVALFCCCYIWLYDKATPVYLVEVKVMHRSPLVSAKTKVFTQRMLRLIHRVAVTGKWPPHHTRDGPRTP